MKQLLCVSPWKRLEPPYLCNICKWSINWWKSFNKIGSVHSFEHWNKTNMCSRSHLPYVGCTSGFCLSKEVIRQRDYNNKSYVTGHSRVTMPRSQVILGWQFQCHRSFQGDKAKVTGHSKVTIQRSRVIPSSQYMFLV